MDIAALNISHPDTLQAELVSAVVVALGSNYCADYYLNQVHLKLQELGTLTLSTAFQNPDFTATLHQPKPDYSNQCAHLQLKIPMSLQRLQKNFKQFEDDCDRQRQSALITQKISIRQVSMDIDILLIALDMRSHTKAWVLMADRYPFKAHEQAGVIELFGK